MKKLLLKTWSWLPFWIQRVALLFIQPQFRVAVAAVLLDGNGKLLLFEHTYRREYPWGLPGGNIQYGEDPEDALRREIREESGLQVGEMELLLIENTRKSRLVSLIYRCKDLSGEFRPSDEISRMGYFDTHALPPFFKEQQETMDKILGRVGISQL